MTDKEKLEKLVAYLGRRMYAHNQMADIGSTGEIFDEKIENAKYEECRDTLNFIDSLQKEPIKIKKGCKYRCLSDMVNRDTGKMSFIGDKIYLAPKDNTLVSEEDGCLCDTSEDASNFELVEESVSSLWHEKDEEPCEDRQVLVCLSGNYYVDFYHKEDKRFYMFFKPKHYLREVDRWAYIDDVVNLSNVERIVKDCKEPASEDLEKEIDRFFNAEGIPVTECALRDTARHFAQWQKEYIIKRLCNHANIDQMVEKFEDKYKTKKVLDIEYYKRGIFDTLRLLRRTGL